MNHWSESCIRYEPPSITVDGTVLTPFFNDEVDPTLPADEMIEIQYIVNSEPGQGYPGMAVTQRSYTFTNSTHDDYAIFEVEYQYTRQAGDNPDRLIPDNPLEGWIGIMFGFQPCEYGARQLDMYGYFASMDDGDDMTDFMAVENQYSSTRDSMFISYTWDVDNPDYAGDDTGDPHPITGEFLSPQYAGYTMPHVDSDVDDQSDDSSNPRTIGVDAMDSDVMWGDNEDLAVTIFASEEKIHNVEIIGAPICFQYTKQFHFETDDVIKVVHAVAAGGLSIEKCKEYGAQWKAGSLTDEQKNDFLATGRDSLIKTMDRATWAWENNMDIAVPPPSPDLEITSGPDQIHIEWSDVSDVPDPITDENDFAGYRLYRSLGLRDTVYTEIYEGTATTFVDTNVTRGFSYYYYVTAFDDGSQNNDQFEPGKSLESSAFLNRISTAAIPFKPGSANTDQVLVIPNPFDREATALNYPGEPNQILFVNLPPICTIRIYTVSGNLIKTINHTSGSADESWDTITAFNQFIASGIYIFRVDDAKTWEGKTLDSTFGKFIVIR